MSKADTSALLSVQGLHKHYSMGDSDLHVLKGVDLHVKEGEWLAILGASGSGKSTLLHLMGGLDRPFSGQVHFRGNSVFGMSSRQINRYRNTDVGFVFQFYHLLPELSALENTTISSMVNRNLGAWLSGRKNVKQQATELLQSLGLGERLKHSPNRLSGGERQRVAIARALINKPAVLLADEPTGNLDSKTGKQILDLFVRLHAEGQTIVMVTHDQQVASLADRQLTLREGKLV